MDKKAEIKNMGMWETARWFFPAMPLLFLAYIIGYAVLWVLWANTWLSISMWPLFYFIYKKYGTVRQ